MKQTKYTKLASTILFFTAPLVADSCSNSVAPYFSIRSQSVNLPRILSGLVDHVYRFNKEEFYANFAITPGYSRSFREESITRCLFGNSLQGCECPFIKISGSRVTDRGNCDWLAEYFGLASDHQSSVTFKPRIKNFFIDFALHVEFDECMNGIWFKIWTPFVHTRWDLNWCESRPSGVEGLSPGYFNGIGVTNENVLKSAKEFFQDRKTPTLGTGGGSAVTFESLSSCRWGDCKCDTDLTKNGFADLRFALGWNFFQGKNYHIGLGIITAAPTGTRPSGCFLFEPIIGNGKHWELGGLWTSHVLFWNSEDETKHFGGYLDANITHLFKARQKRCFDLCGKPMSRYMLAEKLGTPVEQLFANPDQGTAANSEKPSAQFKNAFAPVANLTCSDVDVSVGVQADVVAMLNYTHGGFSWDLGYNLWARSCEKIELDCDCPPRIVAEKNSWALKGDAYVYGFGAINATTASLQNAQIALSATQSNATIHTGTNLTSGLDFGQQKRNPAIDNAQFAMAAIFGATTVANNSDQIVFEPNVGGSANTQSNTSKDPVFINQCNINLEGARTKGLSHSIFTHISYSWNNNENRTPFLGIGAQGEFSNNSSKDCKTCCPASGDSSCDTSCSANNCNTCCDSCQRCSVSQWYVWVKGGISFN